MSQSLPGLNSTNMAVLVGDRLRGTPGAIVATAGICLPSAFLMFFVGMFHRQHGARPLVTATFHGVTAAAVGLVAAVALQIGRKVLMRVVSLAKGALIGPTSVLIAGVVFLLLVRTKINPAVLVLCGAVAGLYAFGLG